jgi:hypothetical protein
VNNYYRVLGEKGMDLLVYDILLDLVQTWRGEGRKEPERRLGFVKGSRYPVSMIRLIH